MDVYGLAKNNNLSDRNSSNNNGQVQYGIISLGQVTCGKLKARPEFDCPFPRLPVLLS